MWAALVIACAFLTPQVGAPSASAAQASIDTLQVSAGPTGAVVVITGRGALPVPTVGTVDNPARIYLDLAGVSTRTIAQPSSNTPPVLRVRAATHSLSPLVTRIVIDLGQRTTHTMDLSRRNEGRIEVTVSAPSSAVGKTMTPAAAERSSEAARKASPGAVWREDAYTARVSAIATRLAAIRDVLEAIDHRAAVSADRLMVASAEVARIRDELNAMTAPRRREETHDLFKNACALSATALSLASGPSPENAASAAAGALILLGRAEAGLPKDPARS